MAWGLRPHSFSVPRLAPSPSLTGLRCPGGCGPDGQAMGRGGSVPGPHRGEIIPQDGEDAYAGLGHTHSDVTRGFSSQWKHGVRFTVRLPRVCSWLTLPQPCLPCSSGCPLLSTLLLCCFIPLSGMPFPSTSGFCHSFPYLLMYSLIQQILLSNHCVPHTILGGSEVAVKKM